MDRAIPVPPVDPAEQKRPRRRRDYEEKLRSMPPRSAVQFSRGGDTRRALETLIRGEVGQGEHYVYVHRGAKDEVYYVGKGRGNRAHSRDRLDLWHHYVQTRCNGSHEVEVVKRFDTEAEALDFEGDLIS